jgi:hypothetical protein
MAIVELPDSIERQLLVLDRQVRDAIFSRGISRLGVAVPLLLGACLLTDWFLGLGGNTRLTLLATWLLLIAAIAWWQVIQPLFKAPSYSELAALVERQHPELKERLTSLVELHDSQTPGTSRVMRDLLARQTARAIDRLDVSDAVPVIRSAGTAVLAVMAIALLFAPFAVAPNDYGLLWARLFAPWANFHWGSTELLIVNGDRVVAKGSDVLVEVQLNQTRPMIATKDDREQVWLHWTDEAGIQDSRRLEWDAETQHFAVTLPHLAKSIRVYATAYSSQSETRQIQVAEPPVITRLHLDIKPPAYTGLPARTSDGALGEIRAPERSRVVLKMEFNGPVSQAELIWPIPPESDPNAMPGEEQKRTSLTYSMKLADDGLVAGVEALALYPGPFSIRLKNKLGLTNDEPARSIVIDPDLPPEISLEGSDEPVMVRPEDRSIVPAKFHDDYGLTAVELHLETSTNQNKIVPIPAAELRERSLAREFTIDVADFDLKPGQSLTYRFKAVDNRPVPNPQETWSKLRSLVVVTHPTTPQDKELAQRELAEKQEIAELRADLAKTKDELAKLHRQTEDESLKQKDSDKSEQLAKLQQKQAELAERLQKLAAELGERKLTQKLANNAQQMAQQDLAAANERLEQAKQGEPRDQLQPLSEAIDRLASVDKQLQSLDQQLSELNRLEQDLARFEQVARNADRLAEQLEKLDQQPGADKPTTEQLQKLQAEGQKLAEDLAELFKKHPELVDAARREQLQQLKQLAEQAQQLAKPQQQLAQAFQDKAKDQAANPADSLKAENQPPVNEGANQNGNTPAEGADAKSPTAPPTAKAANQPPAEGAEQTAGAEAANAQQQLAQEAARQALETAKQQGADSKSTQAAADFARQAAAAAQQAAKGDLAGAAKQSNEAASTAAGASKELAESGQASRQASEQAESLSQRQQNLAEKLDQIANSKAAQQGAQSHGQQQLADATAGLSKQLEQAAKNLNSSPLDAKEAGDSASKASQSASEAQQSMQQAAQSAKSNDAQSAASQAQQAAEKLQDAARQAQDTPATPQSGQSIPEEVASKVAQAAQQLQQAQKQLGSAAQEKSQPKSNGNPQSESQPSQGEQGQGQPKQGQPGQGQSGQGQPGQGQPGQGQPGQGQPGQGQPGQGQPGQGQPGQGQPGQGQPGQGQPGQGQPGQGQPGQGQPGQGQPGQGQPGQGQPGQGQPGSAIAQSAKQFRQAADAMRRAANSDGQPSSKGGLNPPPQGDPQQAQADPNGEPGAAGPGGGNTGSGVTGTSGDLNELNAALKKQTPRNWGQLPGQLKTEILQGANKRPRPEYEKQIKSYFEEITKPAAKDPAPK